MIRIKARDLNAYGVLDCLDAPVEVFKYIMYSMYLIQKNLEILADNRSKNDIGFLTHEEFREQQKKYNVVSF